MMLVQEEISDSRMAWDRGLVMIPSYMAVLQLTAELGYQTVALEPRFPPAPGLEDYHSARRRVFFCSRRTPLEPLATLAERPGSYLDALGNANLGNEDLIGGREALRYVLAALRRRLYFWRGAPGR